MNTQSKTIKLSAITDIRSGHPFRGQVKHTPESWDYYVLQQRDVQKDAQIDLKQAVKLKFTELKAPQTLKPGDILLRSRGGYYYAGLFNSDINNVLAAGQFFVLSPNTQVIAPAYLCWYLNQSVAQQYFEKNDSGSNIPMINKRTISDLKIKLPSLETQHKVAHIHQSWLKEKQLTEQLLINREQMLHGICQQLINRDVT